MIIAFQSTRLRELCEDPDSADGAMSRDVAETFRDRLADVRAATSFEDLIVGNPRRDGPEGQYLRISIGPDMEIVFEANHRRPGRDADGNVDWNRVAYVKIVEVVGL